MNRKLCALFLSAVMLLISCASSKSDSSQIVDNSQVESSETEKSIEPSEPVEMPETKEPEPETAQPEYPSKTLQIYNGIDIVREYEITSESPLWYIGEELTTVDEMIDEEPDIGDFFMGARGWLLEYEDFLLFSYDMEYSSAHVTTVSPYTGCDLFGGYRMGYLRLSELKELLGNSKVSESESTGYQTLSSVFRFKEYPQNYYSMVFSFENGYDDERCTMLTTYVSSEPIANNIDNYYDDSYYGDNYYDDNSSTTGTPKETEPIEGPYRDAIIELNEKSNASSVVYSFFIYLKEHNAEGALSCTTQNDESFIQAVKSAANPDAVLEELTSDPQNYVLARIINEIIIPMAEDYGLDYKIGDIGLGSDTEASCRITVNCFSVYKAIFSIFDYLSKVTDQELERYTKEFNEAYPGENTDSDEFNLFILKKMAWKSSNNIVSSIGDYYVYEVYLEKINGEWYISGFSNNLDFIDMYFCRMSELEKHKDYVNFLLTGEKPDGY